MKYPKTFLLYLRKNEILPNTTCQIYEEDQDDPWIQDPPWSLELPDTVLMKEEGDQANTWTSEASILLALTNI